MTRRVRMLAIVLLLATAASCGSGDDLADFRPTAEQPDPSLEIDGVVTQAYRAGVHVLPFQRVAYDRSPPFGGPHDARWAACNGVVYDTAVRSENMVHALEHGAVWIAYDPARITGAAVAALADRVRGRSYLLLSPYPGLDRPISLQSWGHQLKLDDPADERIDQFMVALRANQYTHPEVGGSCDPLPGLFDVDDPPPFDPTPPGPDAKPMTFGG